MFCKIKTKIAFSQPRTKKGVKNIIKIKKKNNLMVEVNFLIKIEENKKKGIKLTT